MEIRSRHGIYYDITKSHFKVHLLGITFVFSSQLNLAKFTTSYIEEIQRFNESVNRIYKEKFNLFFDVLALVRYYSVIEKRDFYLIVKGEEVRCPEDLVFLASVDNKNSEKRSAN